MSVDKKHLALFKKWISRLGLTEWRIKFVDNCAPEDMMIADSCGCTEFQESTRTARVQIMDEKYWGSRIDRDRMLPVASFSLAEPERARALVAAQRDKEQSDGA